jgi:type I restriction enzyme R subunit
MELVRQVDVNIDYILMLIEKYRDEHGSDKELKGALDKAIGSSINLRSKRELIEAFIADVNAEGNIAEAWMKFVEERKKRDLSELIEKERLKDTETEKLFEGALKTGVLKTTGTDIDLILPPLSRFGNVRQITKERVILALQGLFERYKGL